MSLHAPTISYSSDRYQGGFELRNKYSGYCYRCGGFVDRGEGHFERKRNGWRLQHADCAVKYRGTKVQGNGERPEQEAKKCHTQN